jgi:hypothetical protein
VEGVAAIPDAAERTAASSESCCHLDSRVDRRALNA